MGNALLLHIPKPAREILSPQHAYKVVSFAGNDPAVFVMSRQCFPSKLETHYYFKQLAAADQHPAKLGRHCEYHAFFLGLQASCH